MATSGESGKPTNSVQLIAAVIIGMLTIGISAFWSYLSGFHPMTLLLLFIEVGFCGFAIWAIASDAAGDVRLEKVLFPVALIVGSLCYATAFTPLSTFDEDYHYVASYMWSNLFFEGAPSNTMRLEDVQDLADPGMNYWFSSKSIDTTAREFSWTASTDELSTVRDFQKRYARAASLRPDFKTPDVRSGVSITSNPLQTKLPSAIGIALGRFFGLGSIPTFYLGRYLNALACSILIVVAVRIVPFGKKTLMALALLPTSLELLGSYSYDGPIIAMSLLLISVSLRAIRSTERMAIGECVALLAISSLLAPCKMVYYPLALLSLAIPSKRFSSRPIEIVFKGSMLIIPAVVILLTRMASLGYVSGSQTVPVTSGGESTGEAAESYTVGWLAGHPHSFILMLANTMRVHFMQLVSTFIGRSLGWGSPHLYGPTWVFVVLWVLLGWSTVRSADDDGETNRIETVCFVTVFVVIFMLIYVAMLLTWTSAGSETIEGVQGRYFIPVAALILLPLRKVLPRFAGKAIPLTVFAFAALDIAYMIDVFALALTV